MSMRGYGNFGDTMLPANLDALVQAELESGERLVWTGQPRARTAVLASCLIWLFAVPWTLFALFWMAMASGLGDGLMGGNNNAPAGFQAGRMIFALFGLPFVLVGLGMLSTPFWVWRRSKKACYALTDRRAIVWQPGFFGSVNVRSFRPDDLRNISRNERGDGSGDLIFDEIHSRTHKGRHTVTRLGFLAIDRVREVQRMLEDTLLEKS